MPLVLLFSDPALLPQIIPNCHNRILTALHAVLYICSYNHPQTHPKCRQHSAGTRESALYAFPLPRVRARLFRTRLYKVLYHRLSPPTTDHHHQQQTGQHHHQQQPPAADSHAPTSATQDKTGQTRRGEGRGVTRRGLFTCSGAPGRFVERFTE